MTVTGQWRGRNLPGPLPRWDSDLLGAMANSAGMAWRKGGTGLGWRIMHTRAVARACLAPAALFQRRTRVLCWSEVSTRSSVET
jgi:hypothetical protein